MQGESRFVNDTAGCANCRERLSGCREQLRAARLELEKVRTWLESRAVRLDKVISDLAVYLEESPVARRSRGTPTRETASLTVARAVPRSDGYFDVHLGDAGPFVLPPMLGRLFQLLAEDSGHEISDGLVGFKSNQYLLVKLTSYAQVMRSSVHSKKPQRDKRLNQAISDLRARLNRFIVDGGRIVQTRRGVGFRVAVRKP